MLKKRIESFKYAIKGIQTLFKSEIHAKIHLIFTILVVFMALYFQVSRLEWMFIILSIAFVFSAEAFNTALEQITNLVSPEHHPIAGKVKDLAAGAVLISAIGAAIIGLIIFLPKLFPLSIGFIIS